MNTTGTRTPDSDILSRSREQIDSSRFALPLALFADPKIFEAEMSRLFTRAWNFLAHETEIPNPGDYVLRHIGADPFIVLRGNDKNVRVLYATCRHRGMQVCRAEKGNTAQFVCPYHGWVYGMDGSLIGAPEVLKAYGETFSKKDLGLLPIARKAIRNGFIFGNLDKDAPSLEDFMGSYAWYFDLHTRLTAGGLVVRGAPQRFVVSCNWKLGAENFFGDAYHTMSSHRSVIESGLLAAKGNVNFRREGIHFNGSGRGGGGGGGFAKLPQTGEVSGYPSEVLEAMKAWLDASHQEVIYRRGFIPISGTMFPNLSFVSVPVNIEADADPIRFNSFRQWRPLAPDKMEIISWCAVEAEAPENWKAQSERAYTASFGSSGMLEQDDTENWHFVTATAKGQLASDFKLNYRMGLADDNNVLEPPLEDWPGPGHAYPVSYAEHNQRQFWRTWLEYMVQV